jgi:hypothetical protein
VLARRVDDRCQVMVKGFFAGELEVTGNAVVRSSRLETICNMAVERAETRETSLTALTGVFFVDHGHLMPLKRLRIGEVKGTLVAGISFFVDHGLLMSLEGLGIGEIKGTFAAGVFSRWGSVNGRCRAPKVPNRRRQCRNDRCLTCGNGRRHAPKEWHS